MADRPPPILKITGKKVSFSFKRRKKAPDVYNKNGPGARHRAMLDAMELPPGDEILIGDEGATYPHEFDPADINKNPQDASTLATLEQSNVAVKQEPWLRFSDEPTRQWRAFVAYRDLGERRSYQRAAEIAGEAPQTAVLWAQKWQWPWRVECFDRYVARVAANQVATEHAEMLKRHVAISMTLQDKALRRLQSMEPGELTPREALWYLKEAVTIERISRGEPQEQVSTDIEDANNEAAQDESWMTDVFSILVESGALPEGADLDSATGVIDAEYDDVTES